LIEQDWDTFVESAMHAWLGPASPETVRLQTEVARTSTTPAVTRQMIQGGSAMDVTDQLGGLAMPLLVFHRREVQQLPLEVSEKLVAAVPDGRLLILEGGTASILIEDFDLALRELVGFVRGAEASAQPHVTDRSRVLTPRELEVLGLLAAGETNAEIGLRLSVSVHTVERHVGNLYRKIDARGRADATAYAVRRGLA
jgi:DNA-binding CsgD family transcriptional regulator